jgi:hypothetical protein
VQVASAGFPDVCCEDEGCKRGTFFCSLVRDGGCTVEHDVQTTDIGINTSGWKRSTINPFSVTLNLHAFIQPARSKEDSRDKTRDDISDQELGYQQVDPSNYTGVWEVSKPEVSFARPLLNILNDVHCHSNARRGPIVDQLIRACWDEAAWIDEGQDALLFAHVSSPSRVHKDLRSLSKNLLYQYARYNLPCPRFVRNRLLISSLVSEEQVA